MWTGRKLTSSESFSCRLTMNKESFLIDRLTQHWMDVDEKLWKLSQQIVNLPTRLQLTLMHFRSVIKFPVFTATRHNPKEFRCANCCSVSITCQSVFKLNFTFLLNCRLFTDQSITQRSYEFILMDWNTKLSRFWTFSAVDDDALIIFVYLFFKAWNNR